MIGRGGMGAVYEGLHIDIGKRVAIKLLETEHSKAEEIAERFRREGRAASRVESEHVVQVFDVGQDATHGLYMVMEYLDGEDLAKRLERERLIDLPYAVDIAWQAARGLAKAHAAGVIHRDLKPGNVFLAQRDDGATSVKIVDFGISKLMAGIEEQKGSITRHGSAVGTPQYMSPEQAQGFEIDHRTDVWALGCVLYEMLAGKQAYELKENYEQTIFAIVLRKPPPLAETAPWVPQPLVEIVDQALEHDLEKRIPDCGTFARILADAARALDLPARAAAGNAPLSLSRRSMSGSNPRIDLEAFGPASPVVVISAAGSSPIVSRATAAATAPAMNAVDHESVSRLQAYQQPPTVTGVAVKTGHYPSVDPESIPEEPPRRSSRSAVIAVLLLGALSAAAAFVMVRGNPFDRAPQEKPVTAAPSALPSVDPLPVPPPSAPAASVSAAPSASVSAKPSASIKPGGKHVAVAPPSASASAAPSQKPPPGDDQFGGVGVSNSY
jgi:serine/threonine-protein kinase